MSFGDAGNYSRVSIGILRLFKVGIGITKYHDIGISAFSPNITTRNVVKNWDSISRLFVLHHAARCCNCITIFL